MASRHTLFRVFYGLGFTPWDGHAHATSLRELIEGTPDTPALSPGAALDVGCGTGDSSIYLAQHGWHVTGVDFVPKALDKARTKAGAAGMAVDFVHADVTHLSQAGIAGGFQLIVDNGCLHGMSDGDRDLYVQEITGAAAPGAAIDRRRPTRWPGAVSRTRSGGGRAPIHARVDAVVDGRGKDGVCQRVRLPTHTGPVDSQPIRGALLPAAAPAVSGA